MCGRACRQRKDSSTAGGQKRRCQGAGGEEVDVLPPGTLCPWPPAPGSGTAWARAALGVWKGADCWRSTKPGTRGSSDLLSSSVSSGEHLQCSPTTPMHPGHAPVRLPLSDCTSQRASSSSSSERYAAGGRGDDRTRGGREGGRGGDAPPQPGWWHLSTVKLARLDLWPLTGL